MQSVKEKVLFPFVSSGEDIRGSQETGLESSFSQKKQQMKLISPGSRLKCQSIKTADSVTDFIQIDWSYSAHNSSHCSLGFFNLWLQLTIIVIMEYSSSYYSSFVNRLIV